MSVRYSLGFVLFSLGCAESAPPVAPVAPVAPVLAAEPAPIPPVATASAGASASPTPAPTELVPPITPEALQVPQGPKASQLALRAFAKGAQIYVCGAENGAAGQFEWTLKAPDATLFDEEGRIIGKHFAGPTWEHTDGSKVVGALKAKADSPNATAIPWLLLEAKSNAGDGQFKHVMFVQRVDTAGGQAPSTGCDKAHDHAEARAEYSATYYFYSRR